MNVNLYRNTSETNKVGKTLTPIGTVLDVVLKDQTSITDPVLLLSGIDAAVLAGVNYIYIPVFLRYYLVKDITSVRNGVWEIRCHVDVLESWKTQIKQNIAIVARQQEKWNLYLNDGQFKIYANPQIGFQVFPSGFDNQSPCYVLAVAGGGGGNS